MSSPSRSISQIRLNASNHWSEKISAIFMWLIACVVSICFLWIVGDLVRNGIGHINIEFLLSAPTKAGRAGGIFPILVSTALILTIALATATPLGIGSAIWLSEFSKRNGLLATTVAGSLDVLAAVPSIVFGLFGNVLFCNILGMGYSILAGGLTLACMILPMLIRTLEASIRSVPDEYRLAATALGISRTRAIFSILLPTAAPGLTVGLVLGTGRALSETAALIFTSGYVDRMPRGILDSGRSLSIHIYDLVMNVPGGDSNAYASALVLVVLILSINTLALTLANKWQARVQVK